MNNIHFMSETVEWETPQDLFDEQNKRHRFDVDVCATKENTKVNGLFFTKEDDGLKQSWEGLKCWMNPPYGREIGKWIEKAATSNAFVVVALLPARPDTRWFHDWIYEKPNVTIKFLKGRLKFSGSEFPAPFPSMLVTFYP